jgi:hypothetical protein
LSESVLLTVVAVTLLGAALVATFLDGAGRDDSADQQDRDRT